jgi:hypothetical protein
LRCCASEVVLNIGPTAPDPRRALSHRNATHGPERRRPWAGLIPAARSQVPHGPLCCPAMPRVWGFAFFFSLL